MKNPRLLDSSPSALRGPAIAFLNYFQVWQWHYRMVPGVQWLYQRIVTANKYRFLSDHVRRSNFRVSAHAQAAEPTRPHPHPSEPRSVFYHSGGLKVRRDAPLVPHGQAEAEE
jgi:hypothetical protein